MKPLIKSWMMSATCWLTGSLSALAGLSVGHLRTEHLENPEGIDTPAPRLSWQIEATGTNVHQAACQILVASSAAKLAADQGDLWDSGKRSGDASVLVPYQGLPLTSDAPCYWKVRVWDAAGHASPWSPNAFWSMGCLEASAWGNAQWIGQDGVDTTNYLTNTSWIWSADPTAETNYFRRVITLPADKKIRRALFEYTGDNECRGWIDQFDLGARNNPKTVKWNNITTRLEPGQTYVFGLTGRHAAKSDTPAAVVAKLTIEFTDGETWIIPTDARWKVSAQPAASWNTAAYNDQGWPAAQALGPVEMAPWGRPRSAESRRQPARYLRKEFAVEKKIARATVSFCGLGLSELYLNGQKVGDAVLSPAFSQYDKRAYYVTYDVTSRLTAGTNALGIILGNGRFYADRSKTYAGTVNF
ncbi:MAG TPA: alpha-L-rhamnosidase N-terminal domain-containing protein, partial [Verrucomicrobiae bacterium]